VSPKALCFHFRTYHLAQSHSVTALVLNQERPAIVRKVKGNKDGCPVHLDICSDEMGRSPLAWPPQSEMHRAYVLYANGGRPSQQYVYDFSFRRLKTHHWLFIPGKATVSSLSLVRRVYRGTRSPGSNADLPCGTTECSRKHIASDKLFFMRNRGASVMIFVNLYLPRPSVHDSPT